MHFEDLINDWLVASDEDRFTMCVEFLNYEQIWFEDEKARFMITMAVSRLEDQMINHLAATGQ